jgi:hypothetical protein
MKKLAEEVVVVAILVSKKVLGLGSVGRASRFCFESLVRTFSYFEYEQ